MQGTTSGKSRHFDKHDQRKLNENWLTGFDNCDQLAFLEEQIGENQTQLKEAQAEMEAAKSEVSGLTTTIHIYQQVQVMEFADIDLPGADQKLASLEDRLNKLMAPDSEIAIAQFSLQEANDRLKTVEQQFGAAVENTTGLQKDFQHATSQRQKSCQRAEVGLIDSQRGQAAKQLTDVPEEHLDDIQGLELQQLNELQGQADALQKKLSSLGQDLAKRMSDAKKEDRGALSEVGCELEDIPKYLERLQLLSEEAFLKS